MLLRCILIVGQGRSGTSWLHDMIDLSPETLCRNEPNEIIDSPLAQLPGATVAAPQDPAFGRRWDDAVQWTATHFGERDRPIKARKYHLCEPARRLGLLKIYRSSRLRKALGGIFPSVRRGEYSIPWWLGRTAALDAAVAVLKLTQVPGWAIWSMQHRPSTIVLHIVRHPGGFLRSWLQRYCAGRDRNQILRENVERLERIAECDSSWAQRFGAISDMSFEETELWYWYYANEVIRQAGKNSRSYYYIGYESLAADAPRIMRDVYDFCGLTFSSSIEAAIEAENAKSQETASAWERNLIDEQVRLVERFVAVARLLEAITGRSDASGSSTLVST